MRIQIIKSYKKIELIKTLIEELDELYDEISYGQDEPELTCVKSKIAIREKVLTDLVPEK